MKRPLFDVVSDIRELVKPLGIDVVSFDSKGDYTISIDLFYKKCMEEEEKEDLEQFINERLDPNTRTEDEIAFAKNYFKSRGLLAKGAGE